MKKPIIVILSIFLMISSITACTGTKTSSLDSNEDITNEILNKEITIIMSKHNTINKNFSYTSVPFLVEHKMMKCITIHEC